MDFLTCFSVLAILPILAIISFIALNNKTVLHAISITVSAALLIPYLVLAGGVLKFGNINIHSPLQFYMDGLNALILGIVVFIGFLASIYNMGYLNEGLRNKSYDIKKLKLFYTLFYAFLWTMILTMTTGNMGIMWIGIEATTLSSAFLVGLYNNKKSIEAAWKYVVICSLGIAMGLLGIIFLHISTVGIVKGTGNELNWLTIFNSASQIDPSFLRLSFILMLVGFGTKAGLAPMHTWLPDAHSQAPAPISAVLSGVLLNTSMYAIMREIAIVNKSFGSNLFTGRLMIFFALFSLIIAAVFIINQKDYKRLLAYSSIEHMGIIAFGLGIFTPASVLASLLHTINHSLTKTMLFFSAGNVYDRFHTKRIIKIKGLLQSMPVTGIIFLFGIFAITGMPPFSIFVSELSMIIAGFQSGHIYKSIALVLLIAIVFVGFAMSVFKMFYGEPRKKEVQKGPGERNVPGAAVIGVLLVLITITGLYIPKQVYDMIIAAQRVVTGG